MVTISSFQAPHLFSFSNAGQTFGPLRSIPSREKTRLNMQFNEISSKCDRLTGFVRPSTSCTTFTGLLSSRAVAEQGVQPHSRQHRTWIVRKIVLAQRVRGEFVFILPHLGRRGTGYAAFPRPPAEGTTRAQPVSTTTSSIKWGVM